ncbi:MAG TPA: metallophosphoesterase family protein [Pyrinomonadaceae bacterium]|nr:metallophosphoesterase family protein [Pyrinomonadaceae bacterium]
MKTYIIGDVHGRRAQLTQLLELIPRAAERDTLVFLGDLVDRGDEIPGVVADVLALRQAQPDRVLCLRGNHEQMFLDFADKGELLWLHHAVGSEQTIQQYTGANIQIRTEHDFVKLRQTFNEAVPPAHLEFFRTLPLWYEDEYALYVHAGLKDSQHPRDTPAQVLLWARDQNFFKHYTGKPCVFGHTPVPLLPLRGRIGRHGIYIAHSAIGLDTGFSDTSPLSCLQLPDFILYQSFPDGHTATFHLTSFMPDPLRAMQKKVALDQPTAAEV